MIDETLCLYQQRFPCGLVWMGIQHALQQGNSNRICMELLYQLLSRIHTQEVEKDESWLSECIQKDSLVQNVLKEGLLSKRSATRKAAMDLSRWIDTLSF